MNRLKIAHVLWEWLLRPRGKLRYFLFMLLGGIPIWLLAFLIAAAVNQGALTEQAMRITTYIVASFSLAADILARKYYDRPLGILMIPLWGVAIGLVFFEEWIATVTPTLLSLFLSSSVDYLIIQRRKWKIKHFTQNSYS